MYTVSRGTHGTSHNRHTVKLLIQHFPTYSLQGICAHQCGVTVRTTLFSDVMLSR